jgi:hypothetical protein
MQEEFEDSKRVNRIHKSKKDRQHNGQKEKYKGANNNLQNLRIKTKDRARKVRKTFPKGRKIKPGKVFRTFLALSLK